ncbi:hypothetical protein CANARDRAFT_181764, partial [[Candida] arabinofermentans NRRL YB-2248]
FINQISTLGIMGYTPHMFAQDEKYIQNLIHIVASRSTGDVSRRGDRDRNMHDEDEASDNDDDSLIDIATPNKKPATLLLDESSSNLPNTVMRLPLPSRWIQPKDSHFEMDSNGLDIAAKSWVKPTSTPSSSSITFNSPHHGRNPYFSTKADFSVGREIGIFYFEIEITFGLKSGADISIGFMDGESDEDVISNLKDDENSWGYNGKEGKLIYHEDSRINIKHSCKFGDKDVVGCGVNFINRTIFITKNGAFLGEAFKLPNHINSLVPVVCLSQWNSISTNFGLNQNSDLKFRYNIDGYVESYKCEFSKKISQLKVPQLELKNGVKINEDGDLKVLINKMISSYFNYMGFVDSLKSFKKDLELEGEVDASTAEDNNDFIHKEAEIKKQIKTLIAADEIDKVVKLVESSYPDLLKTNPKVEFKLQCLKLVNLIISEKIDESITYANQLKIQFELKEYHDYLEEITMLLAYEDPKKSDFFKNFNSFEKWRIIDSLMNLINIECGLSMNSNFDAMVLKIDNNLVSAAGRNSSENNGLNEALLIDLVEDFIRL